MTKIVLLVVCMGWLAFSCLCSFISWNNVLRYARTYYRLRKVRLCCPVCRERLRVPDLRYRIECGDTVVFVHEKCRSDQVARSLRWVACNQHPEEFDGIINALSSETGSGPLGLRIVP